MKRKKNRVATENKNAIDLNKTILWSNRWISPDAQCHSNCMAQFPFETEWCRNFTYTNTCSTCRNVRTFFPLWSRKWFNGATHTTMSQLFARNNTTTTNPTRKTNRRHSNLKFMQTNPIFRRIKPCPKWETFRPNRQEYRPSPTTGSSATRAQCTQTKLTHSKNKNEKKPTY